MIIETTRIKTRRQLRVKIAFVTAKTAKSKLELFPSNMDFRSIKVVSAIVI